MHLVLEVVQVETEKICQRCLVAHRELHPSRLDQLVPEMMRMRMRRTTKEIVRITTTVTKKDQKDNPVCVYRLHQ